MGKGSIKRTLVREAKKTPIPDVRNEILSQIEYSQEVQVRKKKSIRSTWFLAPAMLTLLALTCFGIAIKQSLLEPSGDSYTEVKDLDKVQSICAYQVSLLTTLMNNPNAVDVQEKELDDALSNSIGFVDLILNLEETESKLYQKKNDYYLSTTINGNEVCRFYYNEQSFKDNSSTEMLYLKGYIELKDKRLSVLGESKLTDGFYSMNLMLGMEHSTVCISSDERAKDTYEYRVYNEDAICKTVSLEFKDDEIFMNVSYQNEYFKFQIQGNNNHYRGNYHTGSASGSLMVEIENDKYNFNVDEEESSAERYILP